MTDRDPDRTDLIDHPGAPDHRGDIDHPDHSPAQPPVPVIDRRGREPITTGDQLRREHPVVALADGGWMVLGHPEAVQVAQDPARFSSAVSAHLQIPNGLDDHEHRAFRAVTDPFFTPQRMAQLEPVLEQIARELCQEIRPRAAEGIDAVADIGAVFAVRAQTAWLGWPRGLESRLLEWIAENHEASRSGDLARTGAVAAAFDAIIRKIVDGRDGHGNEVTDELLRAEVLPPGAEEPRRLTHEEVVSVLRNWTAGDLGSIALCVGVVLHALSRDPVLAERIRGGAQRAEVAAIIDELLRRDDPFVSNRRVTTCPVELGTTSIPAGQRVVIHWTSANRDERVFEDPDRLDPEGNAERNLVYGTGPHVCPGRPLATLELCVLTETIVRAFPVIEPDPASPTEREIVPVGGFAHVGVRMTQGERDRR